jgi:DICT domain-containing protein
VSPEATDRIHDYLDAQHVRVTRAETDSRAPKNVAILHDDGEFRAAADLGDVAERADVEGALTADFEDVPTPEGLTAIDDRTFSGFGKRRMIVAAREIEKQAYDTGGGNLYSVFQRLSLAKSRRRIYDELGDSGVAVHVFGRPDWKVLDSLGVEVHPEESEEVGRTWFVAFDGGGSDEAKSALLAEEAGDDVYSGFWTCRSTITDEMVARLTEIST